MAIELQRLVEKVQHMDITLLAGEGGMHHPVSWVHMVETLEASDFLEGGEIAFTTGLGLSNQVSLLSLVTYMHSKQVVGLMVNIGPFIESVPTEVLDFCNVNDFPIFAIPWKIHLAEIMRIFCFAITKDDQRMLETAAAFKNAIFFPKQEELYVIPLSQRGFQPNWSYAVCVIQLENCRGNRDKRLENLSMELENYARHQYSNFAAFVYESELLIATAQNSFEELCGFIENIRSHTLLLLTEKESISIGCGRLTRSVRCLYKSYQQAHSIQCLQAKNKIDKSLIFYSDMGIYKLLMNIEDQEIIQEYYEKTILPIMAYDAANDTDLVRVLRSYLENNCSVKTTAEELFVHRNTINYKLGKIEQLLDMDLSSLDHRLQLRVGLMLQDML